MGPHLETPPTWRTVIALALVDGLGRVLVQQRPQGREHGGLWEFPGGKVEPGEGPAEALVREIAEELRPYDVARVATDQWAADALADIGARHGVYLASEAITAARKVELFESLRTLVLSQKIELPPVRELIDDIRRVRKRVTQSGISIELPRAGGRHCDYAFAAALALAQPVGGPTESSTKSPEGWESWDLEEADAMARRLRKGDEDGDQETELDAWD